MTREEREQRLQRILRANPDAIEALDEREHFSMFRFHDLDGHGRLTLRRIGLALGVSTERARQICLTAEASLLSSVRQRALVKVPSSYGGRPHWESIPLPDLEENRPRAGASFMRRVKTKHRFGSHAEVMATRAVLLSALDL